MDGYTPIPDDAALKAANEKKMPIFKKGPDDTPEEVTESKDVFVEGLFTKDEVVSPAAVAATTVQEAQSPVAAVATTVQEAESPVAAEPSSNAVTDTLKRLAENPKAMADITAIIHNTAAQSVGGRRRTKCNGCKKSHKKGKSSKKGGARKSKKGGRSRKNGSSKRRVHKKH